MILYKSLYDIMRTKLFKRLLCVSLMGIMIFGMTGCGKKTEEEPQTEEQEEVEYDEDGNPIEKEIERTDKAILLEDSEIIITGLLAKMDHGSITDNGIWLTEQEVGMIAERYAGNDYTYEKGSFKKSEVKYVACFYDINGNTTSSMYFDKNMNMCYNNKYKITDPTMKGLFAEWKDNIEDDSKISFENEVGNSTDGSNAQQTQPTESENTIVSLSQQAFVEAGLEEDVATVIAQSTFNLGIPVIKKAVVEANTIQFTDTNNIDYTLSVSNGQISSIYNETNQEYVYQLK